MAILAPLEDALTALPGYDPNGGAEANIDELVRRARGLGILRPLGTRFPGAPGQFPRTPPMFPEAHAPATGAPGGMTSGNEMTSSPPAPSEPGTEKLFERAGKIHNPLLRALGRTGAGILRGADIAGGILSPRTEALIPGSEVNTTLGNQSRMQDWLLRQKDAEARQKQQAIANLEGAQANKANADAYARLHPPAKPQPLPAPQQQAINAEKILDDPSSTPRQKAAAQANLNAIGAAANLVKPPKAAPDPLAKLNPVIAGQMPSPYPKNGTREQQAAWLAGYQRRSDAEAETLESQRGAAFYSNRLVGALDTQNGNKPVYITVADYRKNPGRYMPTSAGEKALTAQARVQSMVENIDSVRSSLALMKSGFSLPFRAMAAAALRSNDPESAMSTVLSSAAAAQLSPEQYQYLEDLTVLGENAMMTQQALGGGRGSSMMREAIAKTIPGPGTPNAKDVNIQLNAVEKLINQLARGVPNAPLAPENGRPDQLRGNAKAPAKRLNKDGLEIIRPAGQ